MMCVEQRSTSFGFSTPDLGQGFEGVEIRRFLLLDRHLCVGEKANEHGLKRFFMYVSFEFLFYSDRNMFHE